MTTTTKAVDDASQRISRYLFAQLMVNTTFGVALPSAKMDQRALFTKLKKHGAIDIRIDALGDEDAVVVIRPEILSLVLDQNVRAAHAAFDEAREAAAPKDTVVEEAKTAEIIDIVDRQPAERAT